MLQTAYTKNIPVTTKGFPSGTGHKNTQKTSKVLNDNLIFLRESEEAEGFHEAHEKFG